MKALILNSGMGTRMGFLTSEQPKCMTKIGQDETILSRQLKLLQQAGMTEVVMTTGFLSDVLEDYCHALNLGLNHTFVLNEQYAQTNYIYSIYLARKHLQDSDILMLHGDLVFEQGVLEELVDNKNSCMTISTVLPLPTKDFKAVIENGKVTKVGVEFFDNAYAAQPLYKLNWKDWAIWLDRIVAYCEMGQVNCYAEKALNEVTDRCKISPLDFGEQLCTEIDNPDDLDDVLKRLVQLI